MTPPSFVRRWRTRLSDAQVNRLRVKLDTAEAVNRRLEQRLADLQAANEGAYHELSIERGNACLKPNCSLCAAATKGGAA